MKSKRQNEQSKNSRVKTIPDPWLTLAVLILVGTSLAIIYSASSPKAHRLHNDSAFFLNLQAIKVALGILAMIVLSRFNYRKLKFFAIPILVLSIGALVCLLIPGNTETLNGARRALYIGGRSLQPAELAKFALIIFLVDSVSRQGDEVRSWKGYLTRLALIGGVAGLVVAQPDFSTGALICTIGVSILYLAGAKLGYLLVTVAAMAPVAYFVAFSESYRVKRWDEYIAGILHPENGGYQVTQSLIGLGDGGLFGLGVGMSQQKQFFLPEPFTDFVFSILGEEFGFVGATAAVLAYAFIAMRGVKIAREAPDRFGALLAGGITIAIILYTVVNIMVVTGLAPATGIPLPFLTYGGSSLLITMMMVGVLLNISKQSAGIAMSQEKRERRGY